MKKIYLVILIAILPFVLMAQSNFVAGVVVTHKGDTLKGFIDYKEWAKNPVAITFKRLANAAPEEFTENDIVYFDLLNQEETYQRYILPISMDKTELPDLSVGPDTTQIVKAVFLKLIEKGKNMSLLSYSDNLKARLFILNDNRLSELIFRKYYRDADKATVSTDNRFKGQLLLLSAQYPPENLDNFKKKVNNANYSKTYISPLIRLMNRDSTRTAKSSNIRFFAGISLNNSFTSYRGDFPLAGTSSNMAFSPGLTFGIDAFLNKRTQKLLLRNEISLSTNKSNISKEIGDRQISHSFEQMIISITPQVIFHVFTKDNYRVNIGGGFSGNFAKTDNNLYKNTPLHPGGSGNGEVKGEIGINKFWYTIPLRTGVVLSRSFETSFQYVYPLSSITSLPFFSMNSSTFKLGLNYLFNKKLKLSEL